MNSRERVIRTLRFEKPDRAPRHIWFGGGTEQVKKRFPQDFSPLFWFGHAHGKKSKRTRGVSGKVGVDTFVDDWGCPFTVAEPEVVGEVKNPPIRDWAALKNFSPPWEILDRADFSQVNKSCAETDKFVLAAIPDGPFERMQFLRGTENLFMDLAYGVKEVYRLRDMIHGFLIRLIKMWIKTDVDGLWQIFAFFEVWNEPIKHKED